MCNRSQESLVGVAGVCGMVSSILEEGSSFFREKFPAALDGSYRTGGVWRQRFSVPSESATEKEYRVCSRGGGPAYLGVCLTSISLYRCLLLRKENISLLPVLSSRLQLCNKVAAHFPNVSTIVSPQLLQTCKGSFALQSWQGSFCWPDAELSEAPTRLGSALEAGVLHV